MYIHVFMCLHVFVLISRIRSEWTLSNWFWNFYKNCKKWVSQRKNCSCKWKNI